MKYFNKKIFYLFLGLLAITQLCDINAMEMFPKETFKLQFSDQSDDEFTEVSKDLAMQFNTIATMIEDAGEQNAVIPLHNITESTWLNIQNLLLPSPVFIHKARELLFGFSKLQDVDISIELSRSKKIN